MKTEFVKRIVGLRLDAGLSQKAFAQIVGLPETTLREFEGGRELRLSSILKLLFNLSTTGNVSYAWLITGKKSVHAEEIAKAVSNLKNASDHLISLTKDII